MNTGERRRADWAGRAPSGRRPSPVADAAFGLCENNEIWAWSELGFVQRRNLPGFRLRRHNRDDERKPRANQAPQGLHANPSPLLSL